MNLELVDIGLIGLFAFVVASGFTIAGFLSTLHRSLSGEGADFRLSFDNPITVLWSVFICMFAGPFIVLRNAVNFWLQGLLPGPVIAFCVLLSAMWSFCSGVFVVQAAAWAGLINA